MIGLPGTVWALREVVNVPTEILDLLGEGMATRGAVPLQTIDNYQRHKTILKDRYSKAEPGNSSEAIKFGKPMLKEIKVNAFHIIK